MTAPACSEADFIALLKEHGPAETARITQTTVRSVYARRVAIERRLGGQITGPDRSARATRHYVEFPHRVPLDIENGIVLVGGDGHYWPGAASVAHLAFVKFARGDYLDSKPKAVIMNGDAFDGARISRHPPIGWESRPAVIDELDACKLRLGEIEDATKAPLLWPLGNHDQRFSTRLATTAPEYARVSGFHLKDHFPRWRPTWSVFINDDIVVKHRFKGGTHAAFNNTVAAGKTMVTNHLHRGCVTPYSDYTGTRYGVDTGCLAYVEGPQFVDYTEDGPKNWREGFAVLTIHKRRLLMPELVTRFDANHIQWRGSLIKV